MGRCSMLSLEAQGVLLAVLEDGPLTSTEIDAILTALAARTGDEATAYARDNRYRLLKRLERLGSACSFADPDARPHLWGLTSAITDLLKTDDPERYPR